LPLARVRPARRLRCFMRPAAATQMRFRFTSPRSNPADRALELSRIQRQLARAQDRQGAFTLLSNCAVLPRERGCAAGAGRRRPRGRHGYPRGRRGEGRAGARAGIRARVLAAAQYLQTTDRAAAPACWPKRTGRTRRRTSVLPTRACWWPTAA
jgi:hypothetical protein